MSSSPLVVGVDVGGTYTDAVCLQDGTVLGVAKEPTTRDVTGGVKNALGSLVKALKDQGKPTDFRQVNIGTTHFLNAVIQRQHLVPVSVLRLCGTSSTALEPCIDFPQDLKKVVYHSHYFLNGGLQYNGREITPLDREEIVRIIAELRAKNVANIVVSCIFAPISGDQEKLVRDIIQENYPGASVTLSHEVGQMGLLERENAAILNQCLKPLCRTTIRAFRRALAELDIGCPFFMTQNDGTIVSSELAMEYPVRTFSSGPTNSMRGAAFLSDVTDNAIVVDIGGTSTDVGFLMQGFPRESSSKSSIAGVTTNFRMPDVKSIGLGGGSLVKGDSQENISVGPTSVGYRLLTEALLFGGTTLTATDIAVAAGLADIKGDLSGIKQIPKKVVSSAIEEIHLLLEDVIDQMKVSSVDVAVIVVGGGSILIDEKRGLRGASQLIKPLYYQSANAVGASLSKVSGTVDYLANVAELSREVAIQEAEDKAKQAAVENGAEESTVEILERLSVGIAYIPGNVIRIKVKAVGELAKTQLTNTDTGRHHGDETAGPESSKPDPSEVIQESQSNPSGDEDKHIEQRKKDITDDSPHIDPASGEWILTERDIEYMSLGAGLLGSGGGGSPYIGRLRALKQLQSGKKIRIIAPERLDTTPDLEGCAISVGFMGAPAVFIEKLVNGTELGRAIACIENVLQADPEELKKQKDETDPSDASQAGLVFISDYNFCPAVRKGRRIVAIVSGEIGGMNSMEPLVVGAELGLPILDCDGMGRAFPELQMEISAIHGKPLYPSALVGDGPQQTVIVEAKDNHQVEMCFRNTVVNSMGCVSSIVFAPLNRDEVLSSTIPYSYSRIWELGRLVMMSSQREGVAPIDAIVQKGNGQLLIKGKITDVTRETTGGFDRGGLEITGTGEHADISLFVSFQNENLVARRVSKSNNEDKVVAMTPDLIIVTDVEKGHPILTEEVQYGLRVAVVTLPSHPILRTEQALKVVGPRAFKYDMDFVPIGEGVVQIPIPPLP